MLGHVEADGAPTSRTGAAPKALAAGAMITVGVTEPSETNMFRAPKMRPRTASGTWRERAAWLGMATAA